MKTTELKTVSLMYICSNPLHCKSLPYVCAVLNGEKNLRIKQHIAENLDEAISSGRLTNDFIVYHLHDDLINEKLEHLKEFNLRRYISKDSLLIADSTSKYLDTENNVYNLIVPELFDDFIGLITDKNNLEKLIKKYKPALIGI